MQVLLLALVSGVSATLLSDEATSLNLKERPVSKVINLLKDMGAQLEKEGEEDEELYEKLNCWCTTNEKEKTAAIAEANRRIDQLSADIDRLTSTGSDLENSIAQLNSEIAQNQAALDKASALRAKELGEFNTEEKDMIQSIRALDGAVTTLAKHQSFLQVGSGSTVNIADLTKVVAKAKLEPKQRAVMMSFLAQPAGFQSYASQSGAIFGILEQMKETFESNMSQSQKDEMQAAQEFSELKAAKTQEISTATAQVDSQTQDRAEASEQNAAAKQNLQDTREALEADTKFLAHLKTTCAAADAEYEERCKTRNTEIQAVHETIGILNNDESHDLMGKTLGFLQVESRTTHLDKRARAARALRRAAQKSDNESLLALAATVEIDAFAKVQAAINEMVDALKKEMDDEVKHRDFCIEELAQNDQQQAVAQDQLTDLTALIAELESTIDTLTTDLKSATTEVATMTREAKRASENREGENHDFQVTVKDQRAVQEILAKALARLKQVYGEGATAEAQDDADGGFEKTGTHLAQRVGLVQTKAKATAKHGSKQEPGAEVAPMPEGFKTYEKNEKSGGVMGMIQGIIAEAKRMETDALRAESDSQAAYESFVKDTNKSIATLNKAITDKTGRKAQANADLIAAKSDRTKTLDDSEGLNEYKGTLHKSCDYVMNNFEQRQAARGSEIDALGEAKAILSGA